jgi:hypothetical protein
VFGHRQVHHHHVDLAAAHQIDRFAAVGGLAGHAQVDLLGKELPQSGADDGVVVDDGDTDHGALLVDSVPSAVARERLHAV